MGKTTLEQVLACPSLPSLPAVAVQVLELTADANVNIKEIARVVQNDQALAAKILRTVNSSYYGLAKPCSTIKRALAYLGLSTVKSIILGFSLVDVTRTDRDGFSLVDYWQRSLFSAAASRRIAGGGGTVDPEEAFIAAMMQDLGMIAIHAAMRGDYEDIIAQTNGDHRRLPELERRELGFDHARVGAKLAESWRLPPQHVEAIAHHHDGRARQHEDLVRAVTLGYEAATAIHLPNPDAALGRLERHAEEWFGFSAEALRSLLVSITEDVRELSKLFKVTIGEPAEINSILSRAETVSLEVRLQADREAQSLRESNDSLARQATTDALTNVGNRKRFDEEIVARYEHAKSTGGSLGLIIADADHFKLFNDTYGHQAGDAVLIELAQRFGEAVRGSDIVCRYGGEEFAIIMPGARIEDATNIAERIRKAVCGTQFVFANVPGAEKPLDVAVSLGVAVFDPQTAGVFTSPKILLKAADRALYAAKEAGRNCVRIFRPAPSRSAA